VKKLPKIKFPCNWRPYPFQIKLWNYLLGGGKQAVAVWHRRSGKDLVGLHWITLCALRNPGLYWYVFPTFEQAKLAIWDAVTLDGRSYLSFMPKDMIAKVDNGNLTIRFKGGSIIKFVGCHTPDNLRGAGIKGVVVSEYAEINKPEAIASVLVPMLIRSGGWVLYLYTPSSDSAKTHGYDLYKKLEEEEGAFAQILNIEQTSDHEGNPLIKDTELKASGLSAQQIRREFYCDFDAGRLKREETTFGRQLQLAQSEGRITHIPYDSALLVNTYWDVGVVDYTVIWFVQEKTEYLDVIDCHISRGKDFYFLLTELKNRGYKYGRNVLPHDMGRRQPPKLDTRLKQANEIAEKTGFNPFVLGRMYHREEMISKTREQIGKCRFDASKCAQGLNCLTDFDASKRKTNSNSTMMTDVADSFMYMAMDASTKKDRELLQPNFDRKLFSVIEEYDATSSVLDYNPFKY
jgi:phage terminase large subunit